MGVFYSFFNIFVYIYDQKETGINRLRLVLYHACMDPLSQFRVPLITVMPVSQITLYIMNIVNIACNFYLYRFLEVQRKTNSGEGLQNSLSLTSSVCSAITVSDVRKERKRNLLPAWVGIYGIIMFLAHTVAWQAAFAIKVGLSAFPHTFEDNRFYFRMGWTAQRGP